MRKRYELAPQAIDDLDESLRYTKSRWGTAQRDVYRRRVMEVLGHLARNPEMGRERPEWGEGVRSFIVERHILIYRIYGYTVEISRILRQNQDIETELGLRESESFE